MATYRVLPMTSAATAVLPAPGPCHGWGVLLGSLLAAPDAFVSASHTGAYSLASTHCRWVVVV